MSRPEQQRPSKPSSVIPDGVEFASFDPLPPDTDMVPRRWWGRHPQEWRSALELAQLLVDPVYRGEGVPRGDGSPVMLVPGFLAGDASLAVMRQWLGRMGYDPVYGARPLKRAVQKHLQDPLADKILAGEIADGSTVRVAEGEGQLVLTPAPGADMREAAE